MTDQQKKAVEEAADKYIPNSRWMQGDWRDLYFDGINEVLNNPEKYGLVNLKSWLIENMKGNVTHYSKQPIFQPPKED